MKQGDRVAFSQAVIRRCGYDKQTADMRGVVLAIRGKLAEVDTLGTWPSEDGRNVRWIPLPNLTRIMSNGAIFGD